MADAKQPVTGSAHGGGSRAHGDHGAPGDHGASGDHGVHGGHGSHGTVGHVVPFKLLVGVFGLLLVLTWVTVAATWIDLGAGNLWLALIIATVKGVFVLLYFMHLRWDRPVNALIFIGTLLFVLLFVGGALTDTTSYQPDLIPGYAPGMPASTNQ